MGEESLREREISFTLSLRGIGIIYRDISLSDVDPALLSLSLSPLRSLLTKTTSSKEISSNILGSHIPFSQNLGSHILGSHNLGSHNLDSHILGSHNLGSQIEERINLIALIIDIFGEEFSQCFFTFKITGKTRKLTVKFISFGIISEIINKILNIKSKKITVFSLYNFLLINGIIICNKSMRR
jgi:hypothetical protein